MTEPILTPEELGEMWKRALEAHGVPHENFAAAVLEKVCGEPRAWLVENGRTFVDKAFVHEANADLSEMKALVLGLRHMDLNPCTEAATAIESLLSELEAREADRLDAIRFRDLLDAITREVQRGAYDRPYRGTENAPMHGHKVPGIWDSDNGAKAGTQCAWCATWNAARSALAQRQEGEDDDRARNN
ncbi:hypothetical protein LGM46_29275 [Burkholderia arboris]|uniref:hypothetical protein n=1 Tax=Burkholderia arboris TaxID=488730 RepID=UPI001CF3A018|nr:hypothetical protein [Burkholderia arboris]MCA8037064.1 hypothetical protein [Burkholderia arboris]